MSESQANERLLHRSIDGLPVEKEAAEETRIVLLSPCPIAQHGNKGA